jgi:hypothetical protein
MYPKISPSCSDIQVLHAEYMAALALTKVQSTVKAIEAAYDQLSAVESAQSWLSDQGIPCPHVSELLIIQGNLTFARRDLTRLINFSYFTLKDLVELLGEVKSEPL